MDRGARSWMTRYWVSHCVCWRSRCCEQLRARWWVVAKKRSEDGERKDAMRRKSSSGRQERVEPAMLGAGIDPMELWSAGRESSQSEEEVRERGDKTKLDVISSRSKVRAALLRRSNQRAGRLQAENPQFVELVQEKEMAKSVTGEKIGRTSESSVLAIFTHCQAGL